MFDPTRLLGSWRETSKNVWGALNEACPGMKTQPTRRCKPVFFGCPNNGDGRQRTAFKSWIIFG